MRTHIEELKTMIAIERAIASKKTSIQLSNQQIDLIEVRLGRNLHKFPFSTQEHVEHQFANWEVEETESHKVAMAELESQLLKV
jgi:hypothetical protein